MRKSTKNTEPLKTVAERIFTARYPDGSTSCVQVGIEQPVCQSSTDWTCNSYIVKPNGTVERFMNNGVDSLQSLALAFENTVMAIQNLSVYLDAEILFDNNAHHLTVELLPTKEMLELMQQTWVSEEPLYRAVAVKMKESLSPKHKIVPDHGDHSQ